MAARSETGARKSGSSKKRSSGGSGGSSGGGGAAGVLRSMVGSAGGADTILDLVERLGLVDVVLGRVKSRIAETDIDEVLDDVTDYLRRNPEVLVVSLGAVTVATGLLVWLNNRREWDGSERRQTSGGGGGTTSASTSRARRPTRAATDYEDE